MGKRVLLHLGCLSVRKLDVAVKLIHPCDGNERTYAPCCMMQSPGQRLTSIFPRVNVIFEIWSMSEPPSKRGAPVNISAMMQPALQTSIAGV
jgi:hypothetical protein